MPEDKNIRKYQTQSTIIPGTRLEALRSPAAGKTRAAAYKHLTHRQRTALVEKLIEFLKGI